MRARPVATAAPALLLAALPCLPLAGQQTIDPRAYLMSDRAAEVLLARSAAPGRIADSATVLVLTEGGYVRAAAGTDGFTCLVVRSFTAPLDDPDFGNPRIIAPHCFNAQASRTTLREILQRSAWIMHGVPAAEVAARTRRWYAAGRFLPPAPGAMAYMLSPRQSLSAEGSHWLPHLMFFYDQRRSDAAAFGAGDPPASPLLVATDDPDTPVMTLLIPVRRWSDGTPAPVDSLH